MHTFERWRDNLQVAPSVKTVTAMMDDYLDAVAPVIADLPSECQKALTRPIDVQAAAVTLLQAELGFKGSPEVAAVLHEVAHTFASAAVRITALHTKPLAD
jgi:hypothetical protein